VSKRHVDCSRTGEVKNTVPNHVFKLSMRGFRNIVTLYGFCGLFCGSDGIGLVNGVLVASNVPAGVRHMFAYWSYWN